MTHLSSHFTLEELTKSQTAKRNTLSNEPDDKHIENLKYLCAEVLEPLRMWFNSPVKISSGFRSELVNHAIGGSGKSLHCHGCAADIDYVKGVELFEVIKFIYERLPFTELIAEYFPGGWIHVGLVKGREKERTLKIKDKNHNYMICDNLEVLEAILNG